jgi:hypothetical protein
VISELREWKGIECVFENRIVSVSFKSKVMEVTKNIEKLRDKYLCYCFPVFILCTRTCLSSYSFTLCLRIYITRWFKYDRDYLCVNKSQFVPIIFEPPCTMSIAKFLYPRTVVGLLRIR